MNELREGTRVHLGSISQGAGSELRLAMEEAVAVWTTKIPEHSLARSGAPVKERRLSYHNGNM